MSARDETSTVPGNIALAALGMVSAVVIILSYATMSRTDATKGRGVTAHWGPGSCLVVGLDDGGYLQAECKGTRYRVWDEKIAFSYALNPGPLSCLVLRGTARCQPRPFKSVSPDAK